MDTRKSIPGSLRKALSGGARVLGTFLKLPATEAVDIAALAGFDFVIVDREHSQPGLGEQHRCCGAGAARSHDDRVVKWLEPGYVIHPPFA